MESLQTKPQLLSALGWPYEYRIVPLRLLDRRVMKCAVRLREQSLRAAEGMHMILSKQVRFYCKVCAERFAAFPPAYEPPQQIAEALEVLRRGRSGVASCSVEVSSCDEIPSFEVSDGLASQHTGICKSCQLDMDKQAAAQASVEGETCVVAKRSHENHMDPCFGFPYEIGRAHV